MISWAYVTLSFIIDALAGVVGILVVLWLERHKRPGLTMMIESPSYRLEKDLAGRELGTWLRVYIHNKNVPHWLAWVYDGETAIACRARITFHHLDGYRVFGDDMIGRWAGTPEPALIRVGQTETGQPLVRLSYVPQIIDIQPGTSELLDVVYRAKGDSECWGWNNNSYLYARKNPEWKLDKGRYIAKLTVKTGGREFTDAFLIVNDVAYDNFRLERLDEQTKRQLK